MSTGLNYKVELLTMSSSDSFKAPFKQLFVEYNQEAEASIPEDIVDTLCTLPYFFGFLIFDDNRPAGFAVCFESFSTYRGRPVLNIHDFMVSSAYRGKGAGAYMLKEIELFGMARDAVKITLEVDEDNASARKLYSKCGFEDHRVALKGLLHWQKYLN